MPLREDPLSVAESVSREERSDDIVHFGDALIGNRCAARSEIFRYAGQLDRRLRCAGRTKRGCNFGQRPARSRALQSDSHNLRWRASRRAADAANRPNFLQFRQI